METIKEQTQSIMPRKFQVYGVGCAKTGSTSLASMFSLSYRAAHEGKPAETNRLIIDWLEKRINKAELKKQLIQRDQELNLELESAHPLGYLSDILVETFPNAKFIITIREPYSWLKSRLNFHHKVDPPLWREYRDYFWKRVHQGYADEEKILSDFNLFSLDTYLSQYSDHYTRVLNQIPKEKFLLIRTSELNNSIPSLAQFLGIQQDTLTTSESNVNPDKIKTIENMDHEFVKEKIWFHCQEIITKYFPETLKNYQ